MAVLASWHVRAATALSLAASVALTSMEAGDATIDAYNKNRGKRVEALVDAFNIASTGRDCGNRDFTRPLVTHAEYSTYFFLRDTWTIHGDAAAKILSDRLNTLQETCTPVYHLDIAPYYNTLAFKEAATLATVMSVSSFTAINNYPSITRSGSDLLISNPEVLARQRPYYKPFDRKDEADFWDSESSAIVVKLAGNEGDLSLKNKSIRFDFIDEGDSLLIVGALTPSGKVAGYSSHLAPDLVAYEGYGQGARYPMNAVLSEVQEFYTQYMAEPLPQRIRVAPDAGKALIRTGTSFVSPDIAGYMADAKIRYPQHDPNEIVVAAMLSTTPWVDGPKLSSDFKWNAADVPFDSGDAGHGAFLPERFDGLLGKLDNFKKQTHSTSVFDRIGHAARIISHSSAYITFDQSEAMSVIRTIGEFVFQAYPNKGILDSIPDTVRITSPSGTNYDLPLRVRSYDIGKVRAAFSVSAFLGEKTPGYWSVKVPEGYVLTEAGLTHTGARDEGGLSTVDFLIGQGQEHQDIVWNQRMPPQPDGRPWEQKKIISSSGEWKSSPGSQPEPLQQETSVSPNKAQESPPGSSPAPS